MNGGFWFWFTVQVGIPGGFLLWLFASDVYRVALGKHQGHSKARNKTQSL